MADFNKAFAITKGNEGGYNPGIGEKETYEGIDRGANPNWPGWKLIDQIKHDHPGITVKEMNTILGSNIELQADIQKFYKLNYWDPFQGDKIKDQQVANNLFDCSVNQGEGIARRFMQQACNDVITNTNSRLPRLALDGVIGPATLASLNSLSALKLNFLINQYREERYRDSEGFAAHGAVWLSRLKRYV